MNRCKGKGIGTRELPTGQHDWVASHTTPTGYRCRRCGLDKDGEAVTAATQGEYRLKFEIPGLPKATNGLLGKSRWTAVNNARLWKKQVFCALVGQRPPRPLEFAKLILTRFNYRTLDYDGLVASFKPVVDGLVECGVLKNDTWKITGPWDVRQEYTPKGTERIRVEVVAVTAEGGMG